MNDGFLGEKISVIIPVYNAKDYVEDLVHDLWEQSYTNMEIIIVDDGSTDGSLEIIQDLCSQDKRIVVIQTENGGPSKARNIGLDNANGEYIRFLDADDRIPPSSMKDMLEVFKDNPHIDLVIGNYNCIPYKGYFNGNSIKTGVVQPNEFANIFVQHVKSFYFGVPWNKLYKSNIIKKNRIRFQEDIFWCEDFLFNLQYYKECKFFYFLKSLLGTYNYYIRPTGITSNLDEKCKCGTKVIDEIRYKNARDYFSLYKKEKEFDLEWNNSNLYAQISMLLNQTEISIRNRYMQFINILEIQEKYEYICMKSKETKLFLWKLLKWARKYEKYIFAFGFLFFKCRILSKSSIIMKVLKKIFYTKFPSYY